MTEQLLKNEINPSMLLEFNTLLSNGNVTTLYQPIVDIRQGTILGYEALSRGPEHSMLHSPLVLLSIAELLNKTWELERLLRVKALENATFTNDYLLFLNVDPNVVKDQKFKKGFTRANLEKMNIAPGAIVLELTERSAIENYSDFKEVLKHYTDQGYSIAIDDAGSGYSGLKTMYEVYPKYLKIDMDFVRDIDKDSFKQAIVRSLIEVSNIAQIKTIAEGIENAAELRTLIRLGVDYGQGYYIQRPEDHVLDLNSHVVDVIKRENNLIQQIESYSEDYHFVHHVMDEVQAFDHKSKCREVYEYLVNHQKTSVCITEDGYPVGVVTLNEINAVLAKQFGYSVYNHRSVGLIMDKHPMMVDYYTPIHTVAKQALLREGQYTYDDVIVTKGSQYAGMVTMKQMMDYAINYEKKYAKELNPLTGLPGNTIINRVLNDTIHSNQNTSIIYVDLDHFKSFNDVFGFDNGDKVIMLTAGVLKAAINQYAPFTSFLGHIGGDDFIVISNCDEQTSQAICTNIIDVFDQKILDFFDDETKKKGCYLALDRKGIERQHHLTAVSLAGATGDFSLYEDVESISSYLMVLKKEAKRNVKSSCVIKKISPA